MFLLANAKIQALPVLTQRTYPACRIFGLVRIRSGLNEIIYSTLLFYELVVTPLSQERIFFTCIKQLGV